MADDNLGGEGRETGRYVLDQSAANAIVEAAEAGAAERLAALMEPMHPADIADLLEQVGPEHRAAIVAHCEKDLDGEVLSELDEEVRDEVMAILSPGALTEAVRELESDDVVDILEDLGAERREAVLSALDIADRMAARQALAYPEHSAGRLMQREVVAAPGHWTVGQAIDHMRDRDDLPEDFYHVVLVDPRMRPTGCVALGKILGHPRDAKLADIAGDGFRVIPVSQDEEDVAYAFNQYHLISAPVVDEHGRLVGAITIDDAMGVLDEENEEDIMRLAGVGESSLSHRVLATLRRRFPWLFANLLTAILASVVIAQFEETISRFVALAVLMPIVASMGGNAGTQTLTVAVRSIATKDLTGANVWRVIRREALVGILNGAIFAAIMGVVGLLWFGVPALGWLIAAAMAINLLVAALAGIAIPVALERLKIDPALASGAFVTTVTDVVGFFAFLGLAAAALT